MRAAEDCTASTRAPSHEQRTSSELAMVYIVVAMSRHVDKLVDTVEALPAVSGGFGRQAAPAAARVASIDEASCTTAQAQRRNYKPRPHGLRAQARPRRARRTSSVTVDVAKCCRVASTAAAVLGRVRADWNHDAICGHPARSAPSSWRRRHIANVTSLTGRRGCVFAAAQGSAVAAVGNSKCPFVQRAAANPPASRFQRR